MRQLRVAWQLLPLATGAPGQAGGRAWRICSVGGFGPGCGGAELVGSERHVDAPYSPAGRSRQPTRPGSAQPNSELEGERAMRFKKRKEKKNH